MQRCDHAFKLQDNIICIMCGKSLGNSYSWMNIVLFEIRLAEARAQSSQRSLTYIDSLIAWLDVDVVSGGSRDQIG